MERMTIHRALSELKIIDSRIKRGIQELKPVGLKRKGQKVDGIHDEEEFNKDAKEKMQSITDLIQRKIDIKSAIVTANSVTKVKVAGKEMSISDAINYKNILSLNNDLTQRVETEYNRYVGDINVGQERVDANAIKIAEAALGRENVKLTDSDAVNATATFIETNSLHLVDPLDAKKLISTRKDEHDKFISEVDAVLSEINAITFIEV